MRKNSASARGVAAVKGRSARAASRETSGGEDAVRLLDPELSARSRSLLDAVHRYQAADLDLLDRVASLLAISRVDLTALQHIQRRELDGVPVRVRDLEQWLRVSNASASVVTNRLCGAGLIVKEPGGTDRRERAVRLTTQGRQKLSAAAGDSPQALDALLRTVTAEESDRIVELLDAVAEVLARTAK